MSEFEAGTIIDGRYRVLSRLGAGGMADVYLAQDEQLDREVAVKLLHRRFAEDAAFVERFRREAQSAASLQHPNVVSVFDRGAFDGTYYIAMEYLHGRTLKRLIREEAPLETARAIDLTLQMLKAARFAHRRGVIHRDLKPHNVIIDDNDHIKVTDFGIARAGASDMTETGSIMGTAQYLSPEQAQGHAVSAPSDLYSIGIVLYEMLTGRVPFDGESPVSIALKHVSEPPVPPSQINPGVPSALEQVVMWSLNKNPADRPADADQFIMALEQVRESLASPGEVTASMRAVSVPGTGVVPVGYQHTGMMPAADALGAYDAAANPAFDGARVNKYDDDKNSPIWPWILALVVVLLLAGGGVAAYLLTRPKKVTVPPVVNLTLTVAQNQVQAAGLTPSVLYETSAKPDNTVIEQNPLGGIRLKSGSTVTLTVSTGPGDVSIPTVESEPQALAVEQLKAAGLTVAKIMQETSTSVTAGNATRTEPNGGSSVTKGTTVILYVSSGLAVPGVVGDTLAQAQDALTQFTVRTVQQTSTTATAGTVLSQSPTANQAAGKSGVVTLTVAQAPTTVTVPDVLGETRAAAVTSLTSLGLNVYAVQKNVANAAEVGQVITQRPQGNATAKKGATVTITVGKAEPVTPTRTTPPTTTTTPAVTTTTSTTTSTATGTTTGLTPPAST
jgi:eukaryotic-like serine/threonine-protein kinase